MNNHFRLIGGPRDSDIAESLPIDYTVVDTETFDRPDPRHADIVYEETRFVAKWRSDEKVYLTVGHEYDAGELVRRADSAITLGVSVPRCEGQGRAMARKQGMLRAWNALIDSPRPRPESGT